MSGDVDRAIVKLRRARARRGAFITRQPSLLVLLRAPSPPPPLFCQPRANSEGEESRPENTEGGGGEECGKESTSSRRPALAQQWHPRRRPPPRRARRRRRATTTTRPWAARTTTIWRCEPRRLRASSSPAVDRACSHATARPTNNPPTTNYPKQTKKQYLLGFAEPPADGPLTKPGVAPSAAPKGGAAPSLLRHRFPSKAGGSPAWLDPLRLPPRSALTCPHTGAPYRFLLQVYAPDEAAGDRAFHRAVFVFVSPQGERLAKGERSAARAFRCQLPRRNRYYGYQPAGAGDVAPPLLLQGAELELALERDPWRVAKREAAIAAAAVGEGGNGGGGNGDDGSDDGDGPEPFREMELVVEPEPEDDGSDMMEEVAKQQQKQQKQEQQQGARAAMAVDGGVGGGGGGGSSAAAAAATTATTAAVEAAASGGGGGVGRAAVARLLADYERRAREEGGPPDDDELPPSLVDELERGLGRERARFAAFQARVARAPSQVLRYCFAEGASALWPSASGVPGPGDVPPCGRCGGPRRFEFQVS